MKYPTLIRLVQISDRADIGTDDLCLTVNERGDEIEVAVLCNDLFYWGAGDAETIETHDDVELYERCIRDLKLVDDMDFAEIDWADSLYACRRRGMRIQGAAYPKSAEVRALIDACGPEREINILNPESPDGEYLYTPPSPVQAAAGGSTPPAPAPTPPTGG